MSHAPSTHSSRTPLLSACCALWKKYIAGNPAHCSLGGKIAIVLCLLPWGMFRRLTGGRQAAMSARRRILALLESAPESALLLSRMWRPLRWAILAPLVLAQRIYFRRGFVPGLLDACRNLRRAGPATAVRVLDPRTGGALSPDDCRPPLRLREVLAMQAASPVCECVPAADVSIVIPVHNGLHHLERLLPSLLAHTPPEVPLLFIDDKSSDARIVPYLEHALRKRPTASILRNEMNMGFTATVNRAMREVSSAFAVLLNTDTVVPPGWLHRLVAPLAAPEAESGGRIASATPFSNAAVFFSFPIRGQDNVIAPPFTLEEYDKAFSRIEARTTPRCHIHSGVGFCMAVSMACWHEIGPLDEEAFGRGYGEECDWCMRAASRGWINVLVPNLFVQHEHGGSFSSAEKERLAAEHQRILEQRWPRAMQSVMDHVRADPWLEYRTLAAWHLAAGGRGCLLLADLDAEGNGAVAYRERQVKRLTEEGWRILLLRYTQDGRWSLTCRHIAGERPAELDCLDDMDEFFRVIPVARVFINNVAFHPDPLSVIAFFRDRKRRVGFALRYVFHDFLSLCPSLFLLNADNVHCGIPHLITCHHCLPHNPNRIVKETDIATWRAAWLTFFLACDELICFSESSRSIICRVYPIASRLRVEEHEPLAEFLEPFSPPVPGDCLHLAFVGYFVPLKGSRLAMQVLDLLGQRGIRARLHIFGRCPETDLPPNAVRHGPYEREELPKLLAEAGIAAVLFLSIWPETFSYTVQECMQTGVPLICLDLGAPAERLRGQAYPQARIAADASPEGLLAALDDLMRREYGRPLVSFAEKAGEENAHPTEPCPARGGTSVQPPLHETPKKESGHEN